MKKRVTICIVIITLAIGIGMASFTSCNTGTYVSINGQQHSFKVDIDSSKNIHVEALIDSLRKSD